METTTRHTWPALRVVRVPNDTYPDIATYQIVGEFDPGGSDVVWGETDNDPETATLFASAPDLLAALEAVIAVQTAYRRTDGFLLRDSVEAADARAAIAKARGDA